MFLRVVSKSFTKNKLRKFLVVIVIAIGITVLSSMTNIWLDVEEKIGRELRVYGSNIIIRPKTLSGKFGESNSGASFEKISFIEETDLYKIKTVFWKNNILDFAPFLKTTALAQGETKLTVIGTWFDRMIKIQTGENFRTGIKELRRWWDVDGEWPQDDQTKPAEIILGKSLAQRLGVEKGDDLTLNFANGKALKTKVKAIFSADKTEEGTVYMAISPLQRVLGLDNKASWAEVSALTTPDNTLSAKYDKNPDALTSEEFEVWYCTAFVRSIAYQIEEVVKGSQATPVRQISDSDGLILNKIKFLMLIFSLVALIISLIAIWGLMNGYVTQRSAEVGLSKAIGASDISMIGLFVVEAVVLGAVGGLIGILAGTIISNVLGVQIFGRPVPFNSLSAAVSMFAAVIIVLLGNITTILAIIRINTKDVLHAK